MSMKLGNNYSPGGQELENIHPTEAYYSIGKVMYIKEDMFGVRH